jgi:glycosyltransferase involved in cell wall biosynthesis
VGHICYSVAVRIVYIVPGVGNAFYCQNCFRDVAMAGALRQLGHDVITVPMYLPLFADDVAAARPAPVFYGAVGVYLKHRLPFLRRVPRALSRFLDRPACLKLAARKAGSTRARGLEDMTLSMLRGEAGEQAEELDRLATWLASEGPADVVHLSNALLLGLARALKRRLGAAVVCSLQDEDSWVDAMEESQSSCVWGTMAERAGDVDVFVAVSRHYAKVVARRLGLPAERVRTVHIGVNLDGHGTSRLPFDPPVIGYLSRICEAEGFGLLVDALLILKQDARLSRTKLLATGGQTADDRAFIRRQRGKLAARGWDDDLVIRDDFQREQRLECLRSLTVLSVPALKGGAFGTYLIEAMASGVPVVQPRLAAFGEIVEATGGGILYEPNDPATLAAALQSLLLDPARLRELGRRGQEAVTRNFSIEKTALDLVEVYKSVAGKR